MTTTISFETSDTSLGTVSEDMFGGNFLIDRDRMGDGTYDEAITDLGLSNLRYPGGTVTEWYFDLNDPNKTWGWDPERGAWRELEPLSDFLADAAAMGVGVDMVIPTGCLLTEGDVGSRVPIDTAYQDVYNFVYHLLSGAYGDADIVTLEIGNEYWLGGGMDVVEYAQVASIIAEASQAAIDQLKADGLVPADWDEPEIAIQRGQYGKYSTEKGWVQNDYLIDAISDEAAAAIDAVVTHYYASGDYADLANTAYRFDYLDSWNESGRFGDLEYYVTEWNVAGNNSDDLGMRGASVMFYIFSEMVIRGVDAAYAWPVQQTTDITLTGNEGDTSLTISGEAFAMLADNTAGKDLVARYDYGDGHVYVYEDADQTVVYIASRNGGDSEVELDLTALGLDGYYYTTTALGTDGALDDPDAEPILSIEAGFTNTGGSAVFDIGGYGVVQIVFERSNTFNYELYGTEGSDVLTGFYAEDTLYGLGGNDTISGEGSNDCLFGGDGIDTISGGEGHDRIFGEGGADKLYGGSGCDWIEGGEDNDRIYTGTGADIVGGDAGDDQIIDGGGADRIWMGDGNDKFEDCAFYDNASDEIYGGAGNDRIVAFAGDDLLMGEDGNDRLYGGTGHDILDGGTGRDELWGGDGRDQLFGGDEDDTLWGEGQDDQLNGGAGRDKMYGGNGQDALYGMEDDDWMYGEGGADILDGGDGRDFLDGGVGADVLIGNAGNDKLYGGAGDDSLDGGTGRDYLYGSTGNDTLAGGAEDDRLYGEDGSDQIFGDDGNDRLDGGLGSDSLDGGNGRDILEGGAGDDLLHGGADDDWLYGQDGNDMMHGGSGRDLLLGGIGDDRLYGDDENDFLAGGDGQDLLVGGDGDDILVAGDDGGWLQGGEGHDTFVFDTSEALHNVYDFEEGDTIRIAGGGEIDIEYQENGNIEITCGDTTIVLYGTDPGVIADDYLVA
ncbi:calcium-binding protein [Aliiruegeria lutimaris]|uniref:Ca2+-binding protein, RTX toxin-related n=1 Tax=Aliiruegeria lutimaris TaxID=571298 RepID=A0A1G8YAU5_9RHOB|nr:calcium-binding protein [Aliiruegeria lutimaris]SDJ99365.1 Ca2+-binding protein, RTX toxin-related [Aliiruegeria lutimaris]